MKGFKNGLFYVVTIGVFSLIIWLVLRQGGGLESGHAVKEGLTQDVSFGEQLRQSLSHNVHHPLGILLLQIITIILTARLFGAICRKIKQPTVVGEIAAGIFLGPSVIGSWLPELSSALFPAASMSNIQFLSQIGLILFMFVVGMELDLKVLRTKARDAVIISHASIIFPFMLGTILAYWLYATYAPEGVPFSSFALFSGIAMSITAFPVLARIVQEKGLAKTRVGTISITCAAADDITAWCLLAAVIAVVKAGSFVSSIGTILLAAVYVALMIRVVRPLLKSIGDKYSYREGLSKPVVAIFFITLLLSSYCSEVIGIHALFGAFLAGVVMPTNVRFRNIFVEKVEDVSLVLFLPLFFVYTGLRTQIGLLDTGEMWLTCSLIVLVAVTGKFVGSAFAARYVGQSWWESLTIGALMNTRGLMELVVLNIGYDLGVLSPAIFAMMVIMALVTTLMTAPALSLVNRLFRVKDKALPAAPVSTTPAFNMLVSFGNPRKGPSLLRIADALSGPRRSDATVTAMHLSPSNEITQYNYAEFEKESFRHVKMEAKRLNIQLIQFFKASQDINQEIPQIANSGGFDLLLVGNGYSALRSTGIGRMLSNLGKMMNPLRLAKAVTGADRLFHAGIIDDGTREILAHTRIAVGVLVERELERVTSVIACITSKKDLFLLNYLARVVERTGVNASVWTPGIDSAGSYAEVSDLSSLHAGRVRMIHDKRLPRRSADTLVLISFAAAAEMPAGITHAGGILVIKDAETSS